MATKRTKKPSKAAMETAKALLAPTVEMQALAAQMSAVAKQMDQIDASLKVLYTAVTGKPFPSGNVLAEPAPLPPAPPLNG